MDAPAERLRVLILGGYGAFGGRLARLLADEPRLTLLVAGRSREKAKRFVNGLTGAAAIGPVAFDRDGDVPAQLRRLKPHIVADCSGPFQAYGGDPYRVARAAIEQGAHYLDLADAPDFVRGIAALDVQAKRARVFALSGASTTPALTHAVVARLAEDLAQVDCVAAGITPSPRATMGRSVIAAVTACAGKPVRLVRNGAPATATGLLDSRRVTIAPPGVVPLPSTRFSLADVPDLTLLPELNPDLKDVWFGAGIRPGVLHLTLNAAAVLAQANLLPPLSWLTPLTTAAHRAVRWGEHRSGMFVAVAGRDGAGRLRSRAWHVLAEGDDGPFIPAMAAAALIRRVLAGEAPPPGARPATSDVTLADYECAFAPFAIASGVREEDAAADASRPLYRRLLGSAWEALPKPIRALHDVTTLTAVEGFASVERGGVLGRTIADLIGFPKAGENISVRVDFTVQDGVETWTRTFAGKSFSSLQHAGQGRDAHLLVERFGPLEFLLALKVEKAGERESDSLSGNALPPPRKGEGAGDRRPLREEESHPRTRLRLVVRGWRAFGLPMPRFLAPIGDAFEHADDGRFNFHVELAHPLAGLIVRYRGWLAPAMATAATVVSVEETGGVRVSTTSGDPVAQQDRATVS